MKQLKELRKSRGKTQADIAKELDWLSIRRARGWKSLIYKGFEAFAFLRTFRALTPTQNS